MESSENDVIEYYEILGPSNLVTLDTDDSDDPIILQTEYLASSIDVDQQETLYYIQNDTVDDTNLIISESGLDIRIKDECPEVDVVDETDANEEVFKIITMQGGQIIMTETNSLDDIDITTDENGKETSIGYREIDLDGTRAFIEESVWQLFSSKESVDTENNTKQRKRKIETRQFHCRVEGCGKYYMSTNNLTVHMRSHTGLKPFICPIPSCGKDFVTGYSLKTHLRCHSGEKPYPCMVCGKSFKTSGDLSKHYRTHTGERPFACPILGCDKRFTTSNIRKVHVRSHTGERPYVCEFENCGKSFASATNHKNHIRIHTGEKPYACKVQNCNKRFTEYSSLYKHAAIHTAPPAYHGRQRLLPATDQPPPPLLDSTFTQIYATSLLLSGQDGGAGDVAAILLQHSGGSDDGNNVLGMTMHDIDGLVGDVDDYMG